ncbi:hypothetical protein ABZ477_16720 [Microbacterium sp. NPDC019599]|uniref:hypothetical protein n=1 Tax=Microbacterium sp. NPDC019599 TaxID=3154690 RepID=UPI0033C084EB
MSVFSRFRRHKTPYEAVTEEERMARYVYLLNTLPTSVIEKAHASAFKDVPLEQRREMFEQLRPFMAESEKEAAADDPAFLAKLYGRALERRAAHENGGTDASAMTTDTRQRDARDDVDPFDILRNTGATAVVTSQFVTGATVSTYFLFGAGSLTLDQQPGWIGDMVNVDGANVGGFDGGGGGYDGGGFGGFDGGGFGGFDAGGFGGDGGGGG